LGFAASLAPNRSVNAASTAFFISNELTQRNAGIFLSAVMAAPIFPHPLTADELTYSETALESASGVMLNPVEGYDARGRKSDESHCATCALTDSTFTIKLSVVHGRRVCLEEFDRGCMPRRERDMIEQSAGTHHLLDLCS
jgi:hypothetical protein